MMSDAYSPPRRQGMAITGFVFSLLGMLLLCGPFGLVGLILCGIAMSRASSQPQAYGGKGLAIAGLTMGILSLVGTVLLLPAILLPALGQARETARLLKSTTQARGITLALVLYSQEYGDHLPPADADWVRLLIDGGYATPEMFVSPVAADPTVISYHYVPAETLTFNSWQVLLYETPGHFPSGTCIGYHDNRVQFILNPEAETALTEIRLPEGTSLPHLNPRPAP
jgi:hypothetical protein